MKTKLVIFGITGDLSRRKLLPALASIVATGDFGELEIIGISRSLVNMHDIFGKNDELLSVGSVFSMDMARKDEYMRLKNHLNLQDSEQLLMYLSVPPAATHQIVELLGETGFNAPNVKLLLEKPFGVDYTSAQEMNERIGTFFDEQQIYRIDHYLAKEMAQNIVLFRGSNALFSHMWNGTFIEKIEIDASETIGVEGRGQFYEQTGALRDVAQGHLMQLLSLVLMEIPEHLKWEELPALRQQALAHIYPANPAKARRAQYKGYQDEVKNPGSLTETFVYIELSSQHPQWKHVPVFLMTGKAMSKKTTEIRIHFKKIHEAQGNVLTLRIQPNEGVEMELFTKKPGYDHVLESQKLSFSYPEETQLPDAYEQVLVDAIRSRKSLFASSEEVLESWRILQPILDSWEMDQAPLKQYFSRLN
jgi:glucose-6-phosphate 1-dehydrogenase